MNLAIQALAEQRRLLQLEYESEKTAFSQLTEKIGVTRLAERGNAWFPLRIGRSYYNSIDQKILEVTRNTPDDADHNFEYGKPVSLFVAKPDGTIRHLFQGTVSFVDEDRMAIAVAEQSDISLLSAGEAGVVLSFDETTYRAMFEALDRTIKANGRLGELRDLIYSGRKAGELSFEGMRFPYLNKVQESAVNNVLRAKDVAIVHGPPGTGKTTTLVEAIHETLRRESQVLVCAQSNMAVDWISEKLTDRGINVLRLGNPCRVNDKMLSSTYERRFEAHPDYPTLWSVRKAIRELYAARRHSGDRWHQKIDRLKARATELEVRINNDLFSNAHVIASTLTGSASRLLEGMKFSTLFIDEAAQALEAACWIPMRRVGRVILAGDHCQLPPTVKSIEAMRGGLGKSLMERIVEKHPEAVTLLTTQYRMHEEIMRFSSEWFYKGAMEAAPDVKWRGILDYDTPIEWIDTASLLPSDGLTDEADNASETFRESLCGENSGRVNRDEALLTLLVLQKYIERIGKDRFLEEKIDVGMISPYRAQVRYLRHLIKRTPFFKPFRQSISVNTVDGFQGQERDVIVISMVRSNDNGNIGFLRDLRRMNVAMTRARMKLLIVGNVPTLTAHPFYKKLYKYVESLSFL
ncbi:MAG: AAA family ATPase [Muribaculaceae bacterium]|nr:AAA family ATPase [Muribaculaceae bacterium]